MRCAKLIVATLVVAAALQPLLGQAAKTPANNSDSDKTKQFELARASGFDFSKLSGLNRRSLFPQVVWAKAPEDLAGRSRKDSDLCYSLRVYRFSHQDDEPARMTGSTTCTPANRVGLKAAIVTLPAR
jgi:hypothetical protein